MSARGRRHLLWTGLFCAAVSAWGALPAAAQWDPNQAAVNSCVQELTYQLRAEGQARDPRADLDYRSLDVRQQGRNAVAVKGQGSFRRDRFDRGRVFTFDCRVDSRTGDARVTYRWGNDNFYPGYDEPGYNTPPGYRPPPGSGWGGTGGSGGGASGGSSIYPPTNRTFFSGGIVNRASGKALDVQDRSTRDAANVQQWDFAGAPNQTWDVIDQGNGVFSIMSQGSGKALDVANHDGSDGANIQQFRFSNAENQLWRLERIGGGFYQIVSVSSGKCLDVDAARVNENGANVQQWRCSGAPNQQWRLGGR